MCWLSLVVRSPPARRSLSWFQSLLIELWLLVTEVSTLSLILLTTQTMVTTWILPLQEKIPMEEPRIEPGTSWLVVRSSDHQTTRLVVNKLLSYFPFWSHSLSFCLPLLLTLCRVIISAFLGYCIVVTNAGYSCRIQTFIYLMSLL